MLSQLNKKPEVTCRRHLGVKYHRELCPLLVKQEARGGLLTSPGLQVETRTLSFLS